MKLIFCEDPLRARQPDEAYAREVDAADALSATHHVINYESLVDDGDVARAVKRVPQQDRQELAVYRGWMMKPGKYGLLYEALLQRGLRLINDPSSYLHCHHLPESYPIIESVTPKTVWLKGDLSIDRILDRVRIFGEHPIVVKDFVKSQKHYWKEAFFVPSAADQDAVQRVVSRFLELQGDDLNEGLVFREFIEFEPLASHSKSGMPLTKEFRFFVLDGQPLCSTEYWEEGDYQGIIPPLNQFAEIMKTVRSRFFSMDVAKRKDGEWMIVELGDGQVAGLPESLDAGEFYKSFHARLISSAT